MFLKKVNTGFYIVLIISFLLLLLPQESKMGVYTPNVLGYFMIFMMIISILLLLFLVIYRMLKLGFLKGIKESSLNIFSFLIIVTASFFILKANARKHNKVTVEIFNKTEFEISNIKFFGRNTLNELDTLAPNEQKTIFFYGKNVIFNLENDFENEVELRYFFKNKWKKEKVLEGFGRYRVLNENMKIKIYPNDSVTAE